MRHIVLILSLLALNGCGDARTEAVKDKALEKIDNLIGSVDVKRKEIELSLSAFKKGVADLRKARITAQVKHDQFGQKADPYRTRIADTDKTLKKLREYLAQNEAVQIGGTTYSPDALKKMANEVIAARKRDVEQVEGFEKSQATLQKIITTLEKRQSDYESRISSLEGQIAQIDTQADALTALKDASSAMGDANSTLEENVEKLEDKVNDLFADVQVELLAEGDGWDAAGANKEIRSLDDLIGAMQEPTDTIAEIDRILGNEN